MTLLGLCVVVAHRVKEVEEAALRQVVGGELLDHAAAQQPEVGGHLEQARGDALQRRLRTTRARSSPPRCPRPRKVAVELARAHPEGAGVVRGKEPV